MSALLNIFLFSDLITFCWMFFQWCSSHLHCQNWSHSAGCSFSDAVHICIFGIDHILLDVHFSDVVYIYGLLSQWWFSVGWSPLCFQDWSILGPFWLKIDQSSILAQLPPLPPWFIRGGGSHLLSVSHGLFCTFGKSDPVAWLLLSMISLTNDLWERQGQTQRVKCSKSRCFLSFGGAFLWSRWCTQLERFLYLIFEIELKEPARVIHLFSSIRFHSGRSVSFQIEHPKSTHVLRGEKERSAALGWSTCDHMCVARTWLIYIYIYI